MKVKHIVPYEARTKEGLLKYLEQLKFASQNNRRVPTQAEMVFWKEVLSKDKTGYRFLRQKPILRFIADFYCPKILLIIEIDGDSHNKKKYNDNLRDKYLRMIGIETIRYSNKQVLTNLNEIKRGLILRLATRAGKLPK